MYTLGNLRDKPDSVWNTLFSLICCNHGLVTELRSVRWWSDIKGRYFYYHTLPDITKILYILEFSCGCNTVYCYCWWKMLFRRNCLLLSLQYKFKANLTVKLYKWGKKSDSYNGGFRRKGPVTDLSMLVISVNMKYEKWRNEIAMFTALLFEKQVKRKQDEPLLLNIHFHALKDAKNKKKYTLLVPKVSSLNAREQWGEKTPHKISFFRAEEKANCERRSRACECG